MKVAEGTIKGQSGSRIALECGKGVAKRHVDKNVQIISNLGNSLPQPGNLIRSKTI